MTDEEKADKWVKHNCCEVCVNKEECDLGYINCFAKLAYLAGLKADVHTDTSKVIVELEKENAELKKRNGELAGEKASLERWFGEAKEIIKELLESCFGYNSKTVDYEIKAKAEQFLKE